MVILNLIMRFKVILLLVVAAVLVAAYILLNPNSTQSRQGVVELTNLPDQYCPLQASVVAVDSTAKSTKPVIDSAVAVDGCRYITLSKLSALEGAPRTLFIKLPGVLAFRVEIDSIKGNYQYAPTLGDVNGDNTIDSSDESQITGALFSIDQAQISANDLDHDGRVSILDLSLTRINHRAGVSRPDGKSWSKS